MEKIKRLQKLAKQSQSLDQYFNEVKRRPTRYGTPLWSKLDYEKVYIQIKGVN